MPELEGDQRLVDTFDPSKLETNRAAIGADVGVLSIKIGSFEH